LEPKEPDISNYIAVIIVVLLIALYILSIMEKEGKPVIPGQNEILQGRLGIP